MLRIGSRICSLPPVLAVVFRFAASLLSLHSQLLLLIVISQQSAAILVLFIGRRYYLRPNIYFAIAPLLIAAQRQRCLLPSLCCAGYRNHRVAIE